MIALALIPVALVAYLIWQADRRVDKAEKTLIATLDEWSDERKTMLEHYESARAADRAELKNERSQWATERTQLLNRIQAPVEAAVQHADLDPGPQYVPFDDDEAQEEELLARLNGDSIGDR